MLDVLRRTWLLVRASVGDRTGQAVFATATAGYLLLYLAAIRDLGLAAASRGFQATVVSEPLARAVQRGGYYQFEPIGQVTVGPISYLFSPGNVAVGLGLAALVGINLAVTLYTRRRPTACSTRAPTGAIAGIPALLSGSACCGPLLLIVLGVQATATVLTAFQVLLPAATALLALSLLYLGWHANAATIDGATEPEAV